MSTIRDTTYEKALVWLISWNNPSSPYPSNSSSTNHYLSTYRSLCTGLSERPSAWDSCDRPLLGLNTIPVRIVILLLIYLLYLYTRTNKPAFCYTYLMYCQFFTTRNSLSLYIIYDITSGDQDSKEQTSKKITTAVWNIHSDEIEKTLWSFVNRISRIQAKRNIKR